MSKLVLIFIAVVLFVGCQKGPTDEQLVTLFQNAHNELMDRSAEFAVQDSLVGVMLKATEKDFDIMKANAVQFKALTSWNTLRRSNAVRSWIAPALTKLAARQDMDGLVANYYQLIYAPGEEKQVTVDDFMRLLQHPGAGMLMKNDSTGINIFSMLWRMRADSTQANLIAQAALPLITNEMSPNNVRQVLTLFDFVIERTDNAESREALRSAILAQNERVVSQVADKEKSKVEADIAYLNTLYAQGKLLNGEAPELNFTWTSTGKTGKLSDLKGKVVVVDFWATWCGPCVRSFPNVRELQKRYKGFPVEIIGVTSLQGRHIDRSGAASKTVDTKNNPELEYSLMKEFMKNMDMTWTVAFTEQSVFNSEYGVKGIPHVVIIDAAGVVRYNGLNPGDAPFHEAEKIDALLKEAGLKVPAQPMVETNFAK